MKPVINRPNRLPRPRQARARGLAGLRAFVTWLAAPRSYTISEQTAAAGPHSSSAGCVLSPDIYPGSGSGSSGDGSSIPNQGQPDTGGGWFRFGFSRYDGPDVTAP